MESHRLAVEEIADDAGSLVEPPQPLPRSPPERNPECPVLELEPTAAKPEDRSPAARVIECGHHLRDQRGVAKSVRSDQQTETGALRDEGPRGQRRPRFKNRMVRIAENGIEVVTEPQLVVAHSLQEPDRVDQLRPRRRLRKKGAELHRSDNSDRSRW